MARAPARRLLAWRLRWYALATRNLVKRHWQWLLAPLLLLSYGLSVLFFIGMPILTLFAGRHSASWNFVALSICVAIALLWTSVQRVSLSGGACDLYLRTLPIACRRQRQMDLVLLLVADSLLFVPFLIAAAEILALPFAPGIRAVRCAALFTFLMSMVIAQLYALRERYSGALAALAASLVLAFGLGQAGALAPGLSALAAAIVALTLCRLRPNPLRSPFAGAASRQEWFRGTFSPAARIEAGALLYARRYATLLRLAASSALAAAALALLTATGFDARARLIETTALAIAAIIWSGSHGTLQAIHLPVRSYLNTLPLGRSYWAYRDTLSVLIAAVAPGTVVVAGAVTSHTVPAVTGAAIGFAYLLLVVVLRVPQLYGGRNAVMFTLIIAAAWTAGACFL